MNERGHVANAVLLSLGLGVILEGGVSPAALETTATVGPPVVLGALFPDVDTSFGTHRKTFHNVWVLGIAAAFPVLTGNLHYVWIGVATHYVLDLLGNVRGMGVFYPLPGFYDVPVGVTVDSAWADVVTLLVTAVELALLWAAVALGHSAQLAGPELAVTLQHLLG
jgi:hypothetical protein